MDKSTNDAAARVALIAKRDSETKALEKEKAVIMESQARSESHASRIKLLNEMIAEMSGNSQDGSLPLAGMGKYAKMTTREGIMDILSQARGESMSSRQIAKRLLVEGAKSKSKNFSTIVYTECKRLVGLGRLERTDDGFKMTAEGVLSTI